MIDTFNSYNPSEPEIGGSRFVELMGGQDYVETIFANSYTGSRLSSEIREAIITLVDGGEIDLCIKRDENGNFDCQGMEFPR